MASTFAGGTLRVTTPSSYDAQPASRTKTRDLPGGPEGGPQAGKDALSRRSRTQVSPRSSGST